MHVITTHRHTHKDTHTHIHRYTPACFPLLCAAQHNGSGCDTSYIILTLHCAVNKKVSGWELGPCNNKRYEASSSGAPSVSILLPPSAVRRKQASLQRDNFCLHSLRGGVEKHRHVNLAYIGLWPALINRKDIERRFNVTPLLPLLFLLVPRCICMLQMGREQRASPFRRF